MIELAASDAECRLGYGGDALNTALHLARFGLHTAFLTALGSDRLSKNLRANWAGEGLNCDLILTDPARQPGLYAIHTDAAGERTFQYWRETSAARRMFELPGTQAAVAAAAQAKCLLFSLITLAILPPAGRESLLALAKAVRNRGGIVAFDGNYRPGLWPSVEEARAASLRAMAVANIGLPTASDEELLCGNGTPENVARRWSAAGVGEVLVKTGEAGCLLPDGRSLPPPAVLTPVDTSGAGDAFNAGYLAERIAGGTPEAAALRGHLLAGWVIARRGAIPQRDEEAPYLLDGS